MSALDFMSLPPVDRTLLDNTAGVVALSLVILALSAAFTEDPPGNREGPNSRYALRKHWF